MALFLRRFEKVLTLAALSLGFYVLARLEFVIWNWSQYKSKEVLDLLWAFFVGLRFDIAAVCMTLVPVILWSLWPWSEKREKTWSLGAFLLYAPFFFVFMLMNLGDTEFINFVGRRFSYDALFVVGELDPKLVRGLMGSYSFLAALNFGVMALMIFATWKILRRSSKQVYNFKARRELPYYALGAFLVLTVTVIGVRGGLQRKPLNIVNAHLFAAPILNNLVLNSTFTFIKSYGAQALPKEVYFTDKQEMLRHLNGALPGPSLLEGKRLLKPQNVVVIILESFSLEYMGEINGGGGFTPFLDELAKKSLFFKNSYANARRSIEGVAAVTAGIPAMMNEPFISSHFSSNYFVGLGSLLSAQKYPTRFYHGGNNGTMYFDSFAKSAGYNEYYGANEYPNPADNDGTWGIFDEPFLQYMKSQLDQSAEPFLATVFTLSSHNPYRIPDHYKGKFPTGSHPILQSVAYADHSLKRFFDEAEKQPWFKNTLFVITADHTGYTYRAGNDNDLERFRVPLLFYHPQMKWPSEVDRDQVVQHIDVLPSVMDFLGLENKEMNYLGRSVFRDGDRSVILYLDGRYFLVAKDYLLDWPQGGKVNMYSPLDVALKNPLRGPESRQRELEDRLKASIQYFNEGMWDNRLYYPVGK